MKSRNVQLLAGLLIGAVALYFTFRGVSFSEIFQNILSLRFQYLPLAALFFLLGFVVRAYRWRQLLAAVKPVEVKRIYSPLMIGFMGNLLPLRAGEFIRAFLLGKREEIGFSASFATIVVERLFDLLAVLLLFAGILAFNPDVFVPRSGAGDPRIGAAIRSFGIVSMALCAGIVVFCYFLVHKQEATLRFVRFFSRVLPQGIQRSIEEILRSFTQGLGVLRDPRGLAVCTFLTVLLWAVIVFGNYPLYYCYGIQHLVPVSSLVILILMIAIAVMIPTPGFVGPFQLAVTFVLCDLYGIEKSVAVSFSLVVWFLQMGLLFLAGLFFIVRDNVSFFEMSRTAKEVQGEAQKGSPR
jgi:glycosyltransferase 2 family protein